MVDTNSDPRDIDYPIPANDDASKAIKKVLTIIVDAIKEGLELRKNEKDNSTTNTDLKDSSDINQIKSGTSEPNSSIDSKSHDESDKKN